MTNIFYIGYEPKTVEYILEDKNNKIIAVAILDILNLRTFNPINIFYYFLYSSRLNKKKLIILEYLLYKICYFFGFGTTGVYKRYKNYILSLYNNNIQVWDIKGDDCAYKTKKEIDLIIVNIWGLLDNKIFTAPKLGSINIHPSKLPKNIGAIPTLWSLKNKEKESAVSYIYITDKGIDLGDIIRQDIFTIYERDNIIDIEKRVLEIIKNTINNVIEAIINRDLKIIKQDLSQSTKTAKYEVYREIKPELESSEDILNKIKGYPYVIYGEYCFVLLNNRKIYLKNIHKAKSDKYKRVTSLSFKCLDDIFLYTNLFIDVSILDSIFIIFYKLRK